MWVELSFLLVWFELLFLPVFLRVELSFLPVWSELFLWSVQFELSFLPVWVKELSFFPVRIEL